MKAQAENLMALYTHTDGLINNKIDILKLIILLK